MGILIAIAVIAGRFNVDNPTLGSSSRFGFSFVIFLSGIWLGPAKGGTVGVLSNLISGLSIWYALEAGYYGEWTK